MENMQEGTGIKLIFGVLAPDDHVFHVICKEYTNIQDGCYTISLVYVYKYTMKTSYQEKGGYIRTLIHVLSLVLRDQYKSISIGYLLVSDSSALNQQPSIRTRLALFLHSITFTVSTC